MFEGELGKTMMIEQGYVPTTCELPVAIAGPLIYAEVSAGRDPCAGCNGNRAVCFGRPKKDLIPFPLDLKDLERAIRRPGPPPPRPYRRDQPESDYDQVIAVDRYGKEEETIRKRLSDSYIWEDSTTIQDENRGFHRYIAVRLKSAEDLYNNPDWCP